MPASAPRPAPSSVSAGWLSWTYRLVLLLGACAGFAAIWVILAWSQGSQCGWMALLGALDVVWILRLSGWPPGGSRRLASVAGTALIVVLANWWIIAVHMGEMMGFDPLDSAMRLGLQHAWLLAKLANSAFDLAMIGVALVLAAILAR